jgi:hypothetical protein
MGIARLAELKRAGKKIVAVVCWDTPMAKMADAAGVDLVSVGDSVGVNLWGQKEGEITVDELLVVAKAVRRGVKRALVSVDLPANAAPAEAEPPDGSGRGHGQDPGLARRHPRSREEGRTSVRRAARRQIESRRAGRRSEAPRSRWRGDDRLPPFRTGGRRRGSERPSLFR